APAVPSRAMIIMAHPDDPEFFCGGTVALWCAAGTLVSYLILTNGDKGSDDREMTPARLAAIRRDEQQAAADILGVNEVIFFNEPDGELQSTLDLRKRVVVEIRRYQPETIIAPDPMRYFFTDRYINHADHRVAGEIAIDAVFPAARNRMYHPELLLEGLEPHTVKEVHLANAEQSNLWVDITEVFDTKIKAILCHTSQIKEPQHLKERLVERSTAIDEYGREVFREGFRVMKIG
ncbi:MAG: PIG-L family deacetylase, partial [Anaerolineae bacterium]|nr:PIG-L family deacetylase [Anaerolineae bacterium]